MTSVTLAAARPITQDFEIQYQGRELGKATMTWTKPEKGRFTVQGRADIRHPQQAAKVYRFSVDMAFQVEGRRMTVLQRKNRFNREAEEHKAAIENLVPFLSLVQSADFPSLDRPTESSFLAPEGYYQLRWFPGSGEIEAVLTCDDELVARFRVRAFESGRYRLHQVSIAAAGNQVVDFVLDGGPGTVQ